MIALRRVGEACLWLLIIGAAVVAALWLAARLRLVVLPLGLALVLATLLHPPAAALTGRGWPPGLAALAVVGGFVLALGGLLALLAPRVADQVDDFDVSLTAGVDEVQRWLTDGPLHLSEDQVDSLVNQVQEQVRDSGGSLVGGALSGAILAVEALAGLVLALVLLFFLVKDGDGIWAWLCGLAPGRRRARIAALGRRGWTALGGFLRGQSIVAAFDAAFIGIGLVILGVPLVLPLVVLTFFGAYVPIIGAVLAGLAAVLVALAAEGIVTALLVLGVVILVQQLEGNVLQPVVVGHAVQVHPVAILLAVTAGGVLGGIIGAMVATPLLAVGAAMLAELRSPGVEI